MLQKINAIDSEQTSQQAMTCVVIGDVRVGKTTLIRRACSIPIQGKILPTIGVQFASMNLSIGERSFRVKFWDMSGEKKYLNLRASYLQRSNIAIIVFDLTNYQSYHHAKQYIMQIKTKYSETHILLFGNKKDLYDQNPKCTSYVPLTTIAKFVEGSGEKNKIKFYYGCGLSDNKFVMGIKHIIMDHYIPNDIILEGQKQSKTCQCFC